MSRRLLTGSLALIGAIAAVQLPAFAQAPPPTPPPTCGPNQQPTAEVPCIVPFNPGGGGGGGAIVPCVQGQEPTTANPCTPIPGGGPNPGGGGGGGAGACPPGQQPTPANPCTPIPGTGGGPNPGGGGFVPCAQGQQPNPQNPCTPTTGGGGPNPGGGGGGNGGGPPCGPGETSTEDDPCFTPGQGPQGGQGGPGDPGLPTLKGGFLNKVWKFNAEADNYDAADDVLNCTIIKILNLPKKFKDQDDDIVDSDSYVLFSRTTKVYNEDGKRVTKETRYDGLLDRAETVRVQGKIIPPHKWKTDEDDTPVPTVRAKKVFVTG